MGTLRGELGAIGRAAPQQGAKSGYVRHMSWREVIPFEFHMERGFLIAMAGMPPAGVFLAT